MSQQIGKYELIRKIAIGGMAEVFLAKAAGPMGFEKTLVLKRILPHLADDPKFVEMFLSEAKLAAQLNHPNVVQIFDFGEVEGHFFLAMEYVDGPNLRALIRRAHELGQPLEPAVAAKIVSQAAEGLAYAHEFQEPLSGQAMGLIHRDVSPDNILVSRTGAVKVVDFGIAKAVNQGQQTRTGVLKGKLAYMPPEQLRMLPLDLRTDVYALGMVLYELLTFARPFDAENEVAIMQAVMNQPLIPAVERRPDLPQALRDVLDRALEKDRDRRYPSCREMQADLEKYVVSTGNPVAGYQLAQLVTALAAPTAGNQPSPSGRPVRTPIGQDQTLATPQPRTTSDIVQPRGAGPMEPTRMAPASGLTAAPPPPAPEPHVTNPQLRPPPQVVRGQPTSPALLGALGVVAVAALVISLITLGRGDSSPPAPPARAPAPAPVATAPPVATPTQPAPAQAQAPVDSEPDPEPDPPPRGSSEAPQTSSRPPSRAPQKPKAAAQDPTLASLVVDSVPPGQVRVNGRTYGRTPVTVPNLPPGVVKIEVYDPQAAFSRAEASTLSPGKTLSRKIILGKGKVEFRIRPYATVFLDGRKLGETPFSPVDVWEGRHTVKLVNRDLKKEVTVDLEVRAGEKKVFGYILGE